eukprot:5151519-Pleurochrysis_carterae.AAC.2
MLKELALLANSQEALLNVHLLQLCAGANSQRCFSGALPTAFARKAVRLAATMPRWGSRRCCLGRWG